jgi:hypothetical protein
VSCFSRIATVCEVRSDRSARRATKERDRAGRSGSRTTEAYRDVSMPTPRRKRGVRWWLGATCAPAPVRVQRACLARRPDDDAAGCSCWGKEIARGWLMLLLHCSRAGPWYLYDCISTVYSAALLGSYKHYFTLEFAACVAVLAQCC